MMLRPLPGVRRAFHATAACLGPLLPRARPEPTKRAKLQRAWHVFDARGQRVGFLAAEIVRLLQGKHKPTYAPNELDGDRVVVVNTQDIELEPRRWKKKIYYRHSGRPGGLKKRTAEEWHKRDPTKILEMAVSGMLPKNRLRWRRMNRLHLYAGPEHPHTFLEADKLGHLPSMPLHIDPKVLYSEVTTEGDLVDMRKANERAAALLEAEDVDGEEVERMLEEFVEEARAERLEQVKALKATSTPGKRKKKE